MPKTMSLIVVLVLIFIGCNDSATDSNSELTPDDVAGQYETTTLTLQQGNETIDILAVGGFVELTLNADQTTEGRLFFPDTLGLVEDDVPGDFDVSLAGTYTISGTTIDFDHPGDTFVRDFLWTYDNGTLSTNENDLTAVLQRN